MNEGHRRRQILNGLDCKARAEAVAARQRRKVQMLLLLTTNHCKTSFYAHLHRRGVRLLQHSGAAVRQRQLLASGRSLLLRSLQLSGQAAQPHLKAGGSTSLLLGGSQRGMQLPLLHLQRLALLR